MIVAWLLASIPLLILLTLLGLSLWKARDGHAPSDAG